MEQDDISPSLTTEGTKNVIFPVSGQENGIGYLTSEPTEGSLGLVMIQEAWGMNISITQTADRWAQAGTFSVLVPDLYRGRVAKNMEDVMHLFKGFEWSKAIPYIQGAIDYLKSTGCKKIGLVGFCMGGALAIATATSTNIDAAIAFYGIPDLSKFDVSNIKCPIKALFGDRDQAKGFSDEEARKKLEEAFVKGGVQNYEIKIYKDADHAFMNPDRAKSYNPEAAEQAFQESVAFFQEKLA